MSDVVDGFISKHYSWLLAILFCGLMLFGLFSFRDYGVTVDESIERITSLTGAKFVVQRFTDGDLPGFYNDIPDLVTHTDRYYGVALQLPLAFLEIVTNMSIDPYHVYQIRHIWVYLHFMLAAFCMAKLTNDLFDSRFLSFVSVIILFTTPRIYFDAFVNIKDSMFLSWTIISMYLFCRYIRKRRIIDIILLSAAIAIATNTRIFGAVYFFLVLFYVFCEFLLRKISFQKCVSLIFLFVLIVTLFWIIITPSAWDDPIECFWKTFFAFARVEQIEVPDGISRVMTETVPYYYVPYWISITIPIVYLILFIIGIIFTIRNYAGKFRNNFQAFYFDFSFILILVVPIFFTVFADSAIYNGWRHLYFLFVPMLYFMIKGISFLLTKSPVIRNSLFLFMFLSVVSTCVWGARNHPYEMVYFSPLVRKSIAYHNEKDYWKLSTKECLEFIIANDDNLKINIWDYQAGVKTNIWSLVPSQRDRININKFGYNGVQDYIIANYDGVSTNTLSFPFYSPVHHVRVDQMKIASVFKRNHENELFAHDISSAAKASVSNEQVENIFDNDFSSLWTTERNQKAGDYVELQFSNPYQLYGFSIFGGSGSEFPHSLMVLGSMDGEKWQPVTITAATNFDFEFAAQEMKFIRLEIIEDAAFNWTMSEIVFRGKPLN